MPATQHRRLLLLESRRPAPSTAFTPASISGLQLWLDATNMGVFVDGNPVGTWLDRSGNANNATQATAGKQPLYKTAIQNGKPAVRFDAVDDGMLTTASLALPYTIMAVYSYRNTANVSRRTIQGGTNNWLMGPYALIYQVYDGGFLGGPATVQNLAIIHTVTQVTGTATSIVRANGATTTNTNALNNVIGTVALGAGGSQASEPPDGDIFEVLAYNTALGTTDKASLLTYLQAKWGIS